MILANDMIELLEKRYPNKLPDKVVSPEELAALIAVQKIIAEMKTEVRLNDGTI